VNNDKIEKIFILPQNYKQMKKILFGLIVILCVNATSGYAQGQGVAPTSTQSTAAAAAIAFKEKDNTHDFGTIPQGTPVTYNFTFTNTSKVPLVLSSVQPSCGCTSPEWPKEAIAPGANSVIKVTYNAANAGPFTKNVTIVSNAATPTMILYIKGEVKPAQQAAASTSADPTQAATPKKN
jgi:hypothetical protein